MEKKDFKDFKIYCLHLLIQHRTFQQYCSHFTYSRYITGTL